jgi:large subunit ribosomal protein L10
MSEKAINAKKEIVNEIKGKIENAKSVTLVQFNGMDVQEITDLRNKFREADVEYKVYKNTMMRFAFKELGFDQFTEELVGSNALIFSNEDVVNGPKIAVKYIDEDDANKEKLVIKSGIVEGVYETPEGMTAIAKLPSHEVLAGMLVNVLQAPIRNLAQDLNQINAKLVYALDAIREKKENEAA